MNLVCTLCLQKALFHYDWLRHDTPPRPSWSRPIYLFCILENHFFLRAKTKNPPLGTDKSSLPWTNSKNAFFNLYPSIAEAPCICFSLCFYWQGLDNDYLIAQVLWLFVKPRCSLLVELYFYCIKAKTWPVSKLVDELFGIGLLRFFTVRLCVVSLCTVSFLFYFYNIFFFLNSVQESFCLFPIRETTVSLCLVFFKFQISSSCTFSCPIKRKNRTRSFSSSKAILERVSPQKDSFQKRHSVQDTFGTTQITFHQSAIINVLAAHLQTRWSFAQVMIMLKFKV